MRIALALLVLAAPLAGCAATSTSTAYVPQAAPASAPCAPAPVATPVRVIYAAPVAAPCAPAPTAAPCAGGSCAAPQASGGYTVTNTRYTLNDQAASAVMIPADLIGCGASFLRCVWTRVVDPFLPPANASGGYAMSGR